MYYRGPIQIFHLRQARLRRNLRGVIEHLLRCAFHGLLAGPLLLCVAGAASAQQGETGVDEADTGVRGQLNSSSDAEQQESDVVPSEAEQRELEASEDPMEAAEAKRNVQRAEEKESEPERTTGFDIYNSLRVRYREQGDEAGLQDGGSRAGIEADLQFHPGSFLIARYEFGYNLLTGLNPDENFGDFEDTFFTRLSYVGLDTTWANIILGKNWSTYYTVAGFTDRFMGTGGSASGAFNAQTDGGPTGPGRADSVLQTKLALDFLPHTLFKPFDLNVQIQYGNPIPFGDGAKYDGAAGISAVMTTHKEFTVGIAYNHALIDLRSNPSLLGKGISGDARALLVGTRGFGERWYAGLVFSRLENHETTDEGIYFDGWGSEFYGQYQVYDRWWLTGGYNILEPDSNQLLAGEYRVRYAVLGLRYTLDEFRHMLFANVRLNDGRDADGTPGANVYTVGIRWDLSKRGWHISN